MRNSLAGMVMLQGELRSDMKGCRMQRMDDMHLSTYSLSGLIISLNALISVNIINSSIKNQFLLVFHLVLRRAYIF